MFQSWYQWSIILVSVGLSWQVRVGLGNDAYFIYSAFVSLLLVIQLRFRESIIPSSSYCLRYSVLRVSTLDSASLVGGA